MLKLFYIENGRMARDDGPVLHAEQWTAGSRTGRQTGGRGCGKWMFNVVVQTPAT
jgi:hypothetical protein